MLVMAMSSEDKFEHWLNVAQYDLQSAEVMLNNGRWLYVVFMCQQAVEKLTKGLYTLYVDDNTPRIHNIRAVFELFGDKLPVEIPEEKFVFFDTLTFGYLNNRYPDFKSNFSSQLNEAKTEAIYSQTKEVFAWLLTLKP
jgi:HEPN domain-containing protein